MIRIGSSVDRPSDGCQQAGQVGGRKRHVGSVTGGRDLDRLLQSDPAQHDHEPEADQLHPTELVDFEVPRRVVGGKAVAAPRRIAAEKDRRHPLLDAGVLVAPYDSRWASSGIG